MPLQTGVPQVCLRAAGETVPPHPNLASANFPLHQRRLWPSSPWAETQSPDCSTGPSHGHLCLHSTSGTHPAHWPPCCQCFNPPRGHITDAQRLDPLGHPTDTCPTSHTAPPPSHQGHLTTWSLLHRKPHGSHVTPTMTNRPLLRGAFWSRLPSSCPLRHLPTCSCCAWCRSRPPRAPRWGRPRAPGPGC